MRPPEEPQADGRREGRWRRDSRGSWRSSASGEGLEEWPAWSPDGKLLAYVAEVDGYRQLFVRRSRRRHRRQLTHGPRDHIQPAWSPDGARIAYVRGATATGKLEPDEVDGYYVEGAELWTRELGSGREAKLCDNGFNPSYSPDGQRLAFDARLAGAQRVWVADTRGRNPRQVTSDSSEAVVHTQPRWSPDGSRLVFRRIEKLKSDIAVATRDAGGHPGHRRLRRRPGSDMDPRRTRRSCFSSSRGGGLNLWRVPVGPTGAQNGPEQLTTGAGEDVQSSLHPDGRGSSSRCEGSTRICGGSPYRPRPAGRRDIRAGAGHHPRREPSYVVPGRPPSLSTRIVRAR